MESGTSKGQATRRGLWGTSSGACLIPFKITALSGVIHVLLKCAVGYGPVCAQTKILCFELDCSFSLSQAAEQFYVTWPWIMWFYRQETKLGLTWAPVLADCVKICPYLTCTNIQVCVSVPKVIKRWLFRGQHELLRKKKSLYTTLQDTAFSYLNCQSQIQKCGSHFQKRFCPGFFPAQLPRECTCSSCHMVGTSLCCPLINLHSLLNFCIASCACLRAGDLRKSWGTEAWDRRDFTCRDTIISRTLFKIWPALCSLSHLRQLRLHCRAELEAFSGAVTFLLLFLSKSSKVVRTW